MSFLERLHQTHLYLVSKDDRQKQSSQDDSSQDQGSGTGQTDYKQTKEQDRLNLILKPQLNVALQLLLARIINSDPRAMQELIKMMKAKSLSPADIRNIVNVLAKAMQKGFASAQRCLASLAHQANGTDYQLISDVIKGVDSKLLLQLSAERQELEVANSPSFKR